MTTPTSSRAIAVIEPAQRPSPGCLSPEGGSFAAALISANWTSRQESEEIERKPDRDDDGHRGPGHDGRTFRHFRKHLRKVRLAHFIVRSHQSLRCRSM